MSKNNIAQQYNSMVASIDMDGYIYDTYKGNPIYSSMSSIPPSWEPIAWMPKPKFEE